MKPHDRDDLAIKENMPETPLPDYSNPDSAIAAICAGQIKTSLQSTVQPLSPQFTLQPLSLQFAVEYKRMFDQSAADQQFSLQLTAANFTS